MLIELDRVLKKTESIVTKKVGDESIIVPLSDNIADMDSVFTLNDTGTFFWDLIDGERSLGQIVERVMDEYEIDEATVKRDLRAFVLEMSEWLEDVETL